MDFWTTLFAVSCIYVAINFTVDSAVLAVWFWKKELIVAKIKDFFGIAALENEAKRAANLATQVSSKFNEVDTCLRSDAQDLECVRKQLAAQSTANQLEFNRRGANLVKVIGRFNEAVEDTDKRFNTQIEINADLSDISANLLVRIVDLEVAMDKLAAPKAKKPAAKAKRKVPVKPAKRNKKGSRK